MVRTTFDKQNSRTFQGLFKDKKIVFNTSRSRCPLKQKAHGGPPHRGLKHESEAKNQITLHVPFTFYTEHFRLVFIVASGKFSVVKSFNLLDKR